MGSAWSRSCKRLFASVGSVWCTHNICISAKMIWMFCWFLSRKHMLAYFADFVRCNTTGGIRNRLDIQSRASYVDHTNNCCFLSWAEMVSSMSSFLIRFVFRFVFTFLFFKFLFSDIFLSSSCFVVFMSRSFLDFRQPVFTYGTTYTIQKHMWTLYARLGRRPRVEKVTFSPTPQVGQVLATRCAMSVTFPLCRFNLQPRGHVGVHV